MIVIISKITTHYSDMRVTELLLAWNSAINYLGFLNYPGNLDNQNRCSKFVRWVSFLLIASNYPGNFSRADVSYSVNLCIRIGYTIIIHRWNIKGFTTRNEKFALEVRTSWKKSKEYSCAKFHKVNKKQIRKVYNTKLPALISGYRIPTFDIVINSIWMRITVYFLELRMIQK